MVRELQTLLRCTVLGYNTVSFDLYILGQSGYIPD